MSRTSWTLMSLAVAAVVIGTFWATRNEANTGPATPPGPQQSAPPRSPPAAAASPDPAPRAAPAAPSADQVAHWIADTNSDDATRRSAAVRALADAPRMSAVPALKNVIESGDARDRPLALDALTRLALRDGDGDGMVRGAIREVTYHGDNELLVQQAQAALDELERQLALKR